ncbi:MAG: hypothetical protein HeimC3_19780 [Candidatus Heimdallarchaeota archaeon LC_3]|nr:MAG: hypothetical protein HeimC3_19780 [Candidatus Heimdallarchaeota archaeon LC_3]
MDKTNSYEETDFKIELIARLENNLEEVKKVILNVQA